MRVGDVGMRGHSFDGDLLAPWATNIAAQGERGGTDSLCRQLKSTVVVQGQQRSVMDLDADAWRRHLGREHGANRVPQLLEPIAEQDLCPAQWTRVVDNPCRIYVSHRHAPSAINQHEASLS